MSLESFCAAGYLDASDDALPDLVCTSLEKGVRFYQNRGQFRFEDVTARVGLGSLRRRNGVMSLSFADMDGDGARTSSPLSFPRRSPRICATSTCSVFLSGQCLSLGFRTSRGNPYALGTIVTVASGDTRRTQALYGLGSQNGDDEARVFFPVAASTAAQVNIRWPDGTRQDVELMPGRYTLHEP